MKNAENKNYKNSEKNKNLKIYFFNFSKKTKNYETPPKRSRDGPIRNIWSKFHPILNVRLAVRASQRLHINVPNNNIYQEKNEKRNKVKDKDKNGRLLGSGLHFIFRDARA